ncbi:phage tail family protein [Ornithinibacillus sp. BX22]|uniref:Phage tail family protein n=1 Tax=Ornithinibacillus hominis TaxID=2763055 RepID=A0A923RJB3_9BACI|nr:distal tail protein Dit [Ornithinibacillus hominis]MBC5637850.1 phage tail family protein [Ornithinibacillus hominis]
MYKFVDTVAGSGTESTSMSIETVFNSFNLDQLLTDKDGSFITLTVSGRSNIDQKINTVAVPGMDGLIEQDGANLEPREITVMYKITDRTNEGLRKRLDQLNSLLVGSKKELSFTDEDALFYATMQSNQLPEEDSNTLNGTIIFLCSDPLKYGPEQTENFESEVHTVTNDGTVHAAPIVEFIVREPITFAMIQNNSNPNKIGDQVYPNYTMLGRPVDVESQTPYLKYERIFYSNGDSLVGFVNASNSDIDGGIVAGDIITRNSRFVADSYGEGSSWHGPAIKHSLSEPLRDFRMKAFLGFFNSKAGQVGRVEIYLKDVLGRDVCKVALKDTSTGRANTRAEFRAGGLTDGKYIISEHGDNVGTWNNFSGQVHIEREGNKWYCYLAKVDTSTGRHHARRTVEWEDSENKYTNQVAQVVIHIGAVGNHLILGSNTGLSSISIDKINQKTNGVPFIAGEGDIITLDSLTGDAFINGEPRNDLLDFGSDFISLVKGENQLVVHPNSFDTLLRYRKRYR